jgi:hypothetical protein
MVGVVIVCSRPMTMTLMVGPVGFDRNAIS